MRQRRTATGSDPVAVIGVVLAAAVIRLGLLTSDTMTLDGDEAVTGLVARQILDGRHRAFFPGEAHTGTLEQYLQAAALWGLPDNAFTLRLPQVLLAAACCLLVHQVARACRLSPRRALFAAAMFAAGPYFLVYWGTKSTGASGVAMFLALAGTWVALTTGVHDRHQGAKTAVFGLVAGLAFWNEQQAGYLLLPAAWWLVGTGRRRGTVHWAAAWLGFVVGALPSLWHTFATGDNPITAVGGEHALADGARHFLVDTMPDLLGVRDDGAPLLGWLPPGLVTIAAFVALGVAADRHRRGLAAIVALRTAERTGIALLVLAALLAPVLYVSSTRATHTPSVRHVFVLLAIVPVLVAALPLPRRTLPWGRPHEWAALVVVILALHTWVGSRLLIADLDGGQTVAAGQLVEDEGLDEVVEVLVGAGARTAYADYWLAHPLNWEADGAVVVESLVTRRFPAISAAVQTDTAPALVVAASEAERVRDALGDRDATYDVTEAGGWWVFTAIEPAVHLAPNLSVVDAIRSEP